MSVVHTGHECGNDASKDACTLPPATVTPYCSSILCVLMCVCDCLLSMHRQLETNMDDKSLAKELDQWISSLQECKQLEEGHVKILCDKVCSLLLQVHTLCVYLICAGFRMTRIKDNTCCVYKVHHVHT